MNEYVNDYSGLTNQVLQKHINFYYSGWDFLEEAILLRIPDTVLYVRNIFDLLNCADQNRRIIEDIKNHMLKSRDEYGHIIHSVCYPVGSLEIDGRRYLRQNVREWCSNISKISDALMQIINIVYKLGFRQWDVINHKKVFNELKSKNEIMLLKLCTDFYNEINVITRLNNHSKHNLDIMAQEKFTKNSMKEIVYYIQFYDQKLNLSQLISLNKERDIVCRTIELLDYVFSNIESNNFNDRYYVKLEHDTNLNGDLNWVNEIPLSDEHTIGIICEMKQLASGAYKVCSAYLNVDQKPTSDIFLSSIVFLEIGCCGVNCKVDVFTSDSFDVYMDGKLIGEFLCIDEKDKIAPYFHFKRFTYRDVENEKA